MTKFQASGSFYVTMAAKDGENGSDGKGIQQEVRYYARSTSNSTAPTSWCTTPPTLTSTYRYLWSYVKTTYTDGTTESTTPAVIGVYGDTGSPGKDGADGAQGARMEMVYWDECPVGFQFCAGVDGEAVYHIVWESRTDTNLDHTTPYLCIKSYTKTASSEEPSKDSQSATNPHWRSFENMALVATDFLLSRKIRADEIDADNLTVRNVSAESSDGNTTCNIDGETGKLTAKNVDIEGKFTSNQGSIGGFEIADGRLGYNPFPSLLDGTSYVNMTKGAFNAWNEYFNSSSGASVSKDAKLTAGLVQTSITDSRTGYNEEHVACQFIACKHGLKVTNTGVYITSDGGSTWTLLGVN